MRWLERRYLWWFAAFAVAGVALRLMFVWNFPLVEGDTFIYGDIAKNWLAHGVYGVSDGEVVRPTLIRLPGYPAFLATCFRVFGVEHYRAVMLVQTAIDMGTAWLMGSVVWELCAQRAGRARAALIAFGLYCVFPYTANYVSQPMSETATLFAMALALYLALLGLERRRAWCWAGCGMATAVVVLLRPDGGLLLIALLLYAGWRREWRAVPWLLLFTALALTPWAWRNYRTFGVVQPLVPENATDPGEFFPQGFTDWTKTWLVEFCSVYEIAWNVPGETVDAGLLPARAFDSEEQKQRTLALIAHYNESAEIGRELDAAFGSLARERRRTHPLRYYVALPVMREMDMWLRPRTDTFPVEVRWWEWRRVPKETAFAAAYAGLGVGVLALAAWGYVRYRREMRGAALLALYVGLRSAFLLTVATSEPRYTIECFPMVLVFAAVAVEEGVRKVQRRRSLRIC